MPTKRGERNSGGEELGGTHTLVWINMSAFYYGCITESNEYRLRTHVNWQLIACGHLSHLHYVQHPYPYKKMMIKHMLSMMHSCCGSRALIHATVTPTGGRIQLV